MLPIASVSPRLPDFESFWIREHRSHLEIFWTHIRSKQLTSVAGTN